MLCLVPIVFNGSHVLARITHVTLGRHEKLAPIHHAEYPGDPPERTQKIDGSKGILTDCMAILGCDGQRYSGTASETDFGV